MKKLRNRTLHFLVLMGITLWASRFLLSSDFGLYEDDYSRIPNAISSSSLDLSDPYFSLSSTVQGHGLPLHNISIYCMAFFGWHLGGLQGMYVLAFLLVFFNAILFYLLLLRVWDPTFARLAALSFCLYSADTTQAYLTHAFGLQPSLSLLLLAMHAYLSERKLLSYLLATGILITYETPYLLMLVLPLLAWVNSDAIKDHVSELTRHTIIILGLLLSITLVRFALGEGRVSDLQLSVALKDSLLHMIEGPVVSIGTYFLRPIQTFHTLGLESTAATAVSLLIFSLFFWDAPMKLLEVRGLKVTDHTEREPVPDLYNQPDTQHFVPRPLRHWILTFLIGLMLLVLAYPMTFTVRAYAISGRETRVHFAAILGASILFALLMQLIIYYFERHNRRKIAIFIVASWFALLVGFGQIIQLDYQASWENQISFWDQLVLIAPDLEKGTVILVDPAGLRDTKYIGSNTWNLPRILEQIYSFPESWGKYDIPRVYRLTPDWEQYILGEEGVLHLNARTTVAPRSYDRAVDPAQVIYLTSEDNQLARVTGSLTINDTSLGLKISTPDPQPAYEPSVLDSLLIKQAQ